MVSPKIFTDIVGKWFNAFAHPKETFQKEKENASLKRAVINVFAAGFIVGVIYAALWYMLIIPLTPQTIGVESIPSMLFVILSIGSIMVLISISLLFICSAIYYVLAKLLGGKGDFKAQTWLLSLILAPFLLLSLVNFVPIVGWALSLLVGMYAVYQITLALKEIHKLGTLKAFIACVVPLILLVLLETLTFFGK